MYKLSSIRIRHVENFIDAKFIYEVFDKNKLARVSKVLIQPSKKLAYVEIDYWYDTQVAKSFIQRLINPKLETRLVYKVDDWWVIDINTENNKFSSNYNTLTIFNTSKLNIKPNTNYNEPKINYNKTNLLKKIVDKFKEQSNEFDKYLEEIDKLRLSNYNYGEPPGLTPLF